MFIVFRAGQGPHTAILIQSVGLFVPRVVYLSVYMLSVSLDSIFFSFLNMIMSCDEDVILWKPLCYSVITYQVDPSSTISTAMYQNLYLRAEYAEGGRWWGIRDPNANCCPEAP